MKMVKIWPIPRQMGFLVLLKDRSGSLYQACTHLLSSSQSISILIILKIKIFIMITVIIIIPDWPLSYCHHKQNALCPQTRRGRPLPETFHIIQINMIDCQNHHVKNIKIKKIWKQNQTRQSPAWMSTFSYCDLMVILSPSFFLSSSSS